MNALFPRPIPTTPGRCLLYGFALPWRWLAWLVLAGAHLAVLSWPALLAVSMSTLAVLSWIVAAFALVGAYSDAAIWLVAAFVGTLTAAVSWALAAWWMRR